MTHGGLFSGIGGFELAAQWAGIKNIWSVEVDKFACDVLRKNFNHEIIEKDIREIIALPKVDIISGGDPCQPHSNAGLGKGKKDDRYLWPEMLRVIQTVHPTWVVNENVTGSISNGVLDSKIASLENQGYSCQAFIIPASAVGALHQRERVWLIAHDPTKGRRAFHKSKKQKITYSSEKIRQTIKPTDLRNVYPYSYPERRQKRNYAHKPEILQKGVSRYFGFGYAPYGNFTRNQIKSYIIRKLNGVPGKLDKHRTKRIKALGNAIVPQVAYQIFIAIILQEKGGAA